MKCQGKFKYKGLEQREGGNFTNDRGQSISFQPSYRLTLDEQTEKGIVQRQFKIPLDSQLPSQLSQLPLYTDITLEFDVIISSTAVRLVPTSLVSIDKK